MRAAIYLRQSKYHDGTITFEIQESESRRLIERQGWTFVGPIYRDDNISGTSTDKRDGLKALRKAFDSGKFDIAVAHSYSRFSRNMADGAEIVAEMPLATVLDGIPEPDDDFSPLLHMLLAHKFSKDMSKRWKEVQRNRLARGFDPSGKKKFGYVIQKDGTYVPDATLAPTIKQLYLDYISGIGFPTLVERLNSQGIKTSAGRAWSNVTLREYMDRGFPAGFIHWSGVDLEGSHQRIISEDLWAAYRRAREEKKRKPNRIQTSPWFLSGMVKCGLCNGSASLTVSRERSYVRCSNRAIKGKAVCSGVQMSKDHIDTMVMATIFQPDFLKKIVASLPEDTEKLTALRERRAQALDAAQSAQEARRRAVDLLTRGILTEEDFASQTASLESEREAALARVEKLDSEIGALTQKRGVFDHIEAALGEGETGKLAAVTAQVLERIEVHPEEVVIVAKDGERIILNRKLWKQSRKLLKDPRWSAAMDEFEKEYAQELNS